MHVNVKGYVRYKVSLCGSCLLFIPMQAAYTFDAGPNAVIYALSSEIPQLLAFLLHFFPPSAGDERYVIHQSRDAMEDITLTN